MTTNVGGRIEGGVRVLIQLIHRFIDTVFVILPSVVAIEPTFS
jgi:hypothetical protein